MVTGFAKEQRRREKEREFEAQGNSLARNTVAKHCYSYSLAASKISWLPRFVH